MAAGASPLFTHTVEETRRWLDEVRRAAGLANERQAYAALRAVLHTVRDRLNVPDNARFAAQFPTLLRGVYFDAWRPGGDAADTPTAQAFLADVRDRLAGTPDVAPEKAVRGVLAMLTNRLGQKTIAALAIPGKLLRDDENAE